jgi:hypothetical protein
MQLRKLHRVEQICDILYPNRAYGINGLILVSCRVGFYFDELIATLNLA